MFARVCIRQAGRLPQVRARAARQFGAVTTTGFPRADLAQPETLVKGFEQSHAEMAENVLNSTNVTEDEAWFRERAKNMGMAPAEVDTICSQVAEIRKQRQSDPVKVSLPTQDDYTFVDLVHGRFPDADTISEEQFKAAFDNETILGIDDDGFGRYISPYGKTPAATSHEGWKPETDAGVETLSDDPSTWEKACDIPVHVSSDQDVTVVKMNGEAIYIPHIARSIEWALETPTELHLFNETPVIYEATSWPDTYDGSAH